MISLVCQSVLEDIMAAWGWADELTGNRTLICLTYKLKPEPCGGYATQEQIPPNTLSVSNRIGYSTEDA